MVIFFTLAFSSLFAFASQETRRYCEELYPMGSYEDEERMYYYNECMRDYADDTETSEPDYEVEPASEEETVSDMDDVGQE